MLFNAARALRLTTHSSRRRFAARLNSNVIGLSKAQSVAKPHFQIFTSGLAARHTFLIDNDTGKTWLVVSSKRKGKDEVEYEMNVWQPFAE